MSDVPLPPGGSGLPVLGDTLTFLKDGFAFVEKGARTHGPIFRTSLFGRPTAIITGPDASGLFADPVRVERAGSMPGHIETLFAGRSLPLLDGGEHRERKQFVMAAFTRDALVSYLPTMQRLARETFASLAEQPEVRLADACKRLAIETIGQTVLGLTRGPTLDAVLADYARVLPAFASLPIPLPGTAFTRAREALARILAVYETSVREHEAAPKDDGLSRILAARSANGRGIALEDLKRELHHVVIAGFIVWAWFVTAVKELSANAAARERLLAEIRALPPGAPLTLETLGRMHGLQIASMEIRRLSPVVPVGFGKARETFSFGGYTVPKGWMVLWGARSTHLAPDVYASPHAFDPARFAPPREEHRKHEHAFAPNGAGPVTGHKCAGYEFAPLMLQVFLVELYRNYDVALAGPDAGYDWTHIPPEPRDGLRATLKRRG